MVENFEQIQKTINYKFKNPQLLEKALTHKTYAFEAKTPLEYNERLEFLGDSILGFIIAEQLHNANKYFSEGELTRRRSTLVNNSFLAEKANKLGIGDFLLLGRGESKLEGFKNPTNLANALEALIGAVYLDSDLDTVRSFILRNLYDEKAVF
jgi:ribonuclease-3